VGIGWKPFAAAENLGSEKMLPANNDRTGRKHAYSRTAISADSHLHANCCAWRSHNRNIGTCSAATSNCAILRATRLCRELTG
jgi:hypothetical protein